MRWELRLKETIPLGNVPQHWEATTLEQVALLVIKIKLKPFLSNKQFFTVYDVSWSKTHSLIATAGGDDTIR